MADTGIMAVSAQIALILGGTQPDPTGHPYFYSGAQVKDSTGIAGLGGCYAAPPSTLAAEPPYAILMMRTFDDTGDESHPKVLMSGQLFKKDIIRCLLCIPRESNTFEAQYATVMNLRDTIATALAPKMTANSSGTQNVYEVWPYSGAFVHFEWANVAHWALDIQIQVKRNVRGQTYTS